MMGIAALAGAYRVGCTAAQSVELLAALQLVEGSEQVRYARPVEPLAVLLGELRVEPRLVERRVLLRAAPQVARLVEPLAESHLAEEVKPPWVEESLPALPTCADVPPE